jgi:hypothetical protein
MPGGGRHGWVSWLQRLLVEGRMRGGRASYLSLLLSIKNRCCPPATIRTYPEVVGCDIVLLRVGMSVA